MNYLWIGVCNTAENRQQYIEKGGQILSSEVSNDAIVSGLEQNGVLCDSINAPRIPEFLKYKTKKIKSCTWSRNGKTVDYNIGYHNIKYLNIFFRKIALIKAAKRWAKEHPGDTTIFVYQMHSPFMAAANAVKKINKSAKIVQIVPDLPQYMDMDMSHLKRILKKLDWITMNRLLKREDKFILYSMHMAKFLSLKQDSWIVMEGSYDPSLIIDEQVESDLSVKSVMYSGLIDKCYGIEPLLDSMKLLKGNYELWFTGSGNAVPLIIEKSISDPRIKYLGYFPSKKDLLIKQKQATMLISTRNPEEEASKYCFPSKLFEYMISGNPVISTDIKGIPSEYFNYLVKIDNVTAKSIATAINRISSLSPDERKSLGESGKKFIIDNKNCVVQAKKIVDFIGDYIKG